MAWWRHMASYNSIMVQVMVCCLMAPNHYLNQWWQASMRSCHIYLRAISQEMHKTSILEMSLKISSRLQPHFPEANELINQILVTPTSCVSKVQVQRLNTKDFSYTHTSHYNTILHTVWPLQINGLVQDCSNSIANALELLQSCTKPLKC